MIEWIALLAMLVTIVAVSIGLPVIILLTIFKVFGPKI